MKTFDDFINQIGSDVPPLPQGIYEKARFRAIGEKYALPVLFTVPAFVLASILFLAPKPIWEEETSYDFFAQSEEVIFTDEGFYSLFD